MVVICDKPYPKEHEETYQEHFQKFPYPLSDFQKYSIQAIVDGNHTLVSAATGNGKTVSADFAIQHFVSQGKKVIYTCPIKSLSNQKFYDFSQKYPDIQFGIFTGDVKFNPTADVIFATAEILMNYLFAINEKNDTSVEDIMSSEQKPQKQLQFQIDVNTELACVVMDECHFILDEDRGHVWENTILMLPPHIQMVLLSATLDQPEKFASFCERGQRAECLLPTNLVGDPSLRQAELAKAQLLQASLADRRSPEKFGQSKQVVWSSTLTRIVPLTHYGFMTTVESIFKKVRDKETQIMIRNSTNKFIPLKTEKGLFQEAGYMEIKKIQKLLETNQVYMKRAHVLNTLAQSLVEKEMLPALVFTFSRKNVEMCAKEITTNLLEFDSKIPYTIQREAEQLLRRKLPNFQEYIQMPEYIQLIKLLEKGIGIHHSGMIPILREIVELMISKRYIKILFATDSFSIGLNCEIKTVVFTSVQKYDGKLEQYLMPHAYTQMAGRAGRRNIDTVGHVIHCNNLFTLPSPTEYKQILCGKPQPMESKFHLSYSTVLNLIRNGKNKFSDFCEFVNNSMLKGDLLQGETMLRSTLQTMEQELEKKETSLSFLRTPPDILSQYIDCKQMMNKHTNKKYKEIERNFQNIKEMYSTCEADSQVYQGMMAKKTEIAMVKSQIQSLEQSIFKQFRGILAILINQGFVCEPQPETDIFAFTPKGFFASQLAEIHPLVFTDMVFEHDFFESYTPQQLIAYLSCFADVRVHTDVIKYHPTTDDSKLSTCVSKIMTKMKYYEDEENFYGLSTGIDYTNPINYDLLDELLLWVEYKDENSCKQFIQEKIIQEKGLSVGDFVKAILKISATSKEWMSICEYEGHIGLMDKLQHVDELILKYVCTTQSLYV